MAPTWAKLSVGDKLQAIVPFCYENVNSLFIVLFVLLPMDNDNCHTVGKI